MDGQSRTLAPIQTQYRNHLFRSRLEARWAVFFDTLGVKWAYEHEGYDLGALGWYLPDFFIPSWTLWVEIKGQDPTLDELAKCEALAGVTQQAVALFVGVPQAGGHVWCYDLADSSGGSYHGESVFWIGHPLVALVNIEDTFERMFFHDELFQRQFPQLMNLRGFWDVTALVGGSGDDPKIREAIKAACSARFESGGRR